jgi:probable addiction module antidote protein
MAQDIADNLAAAFETGEVADVTHALATIARAKGMSEIAREARFSRGSLYKAVGDESNPTPATLLAIMEALNITLSANQRLPPDRHALMSTRPPGSFDAAGASPLPALATITIAGRSSRSLSI